MGRYRVGLGSSGRCDLAGVEEAKSRDWVGWGIAGKCGWRYKSLEQLLQGPSDLEGEG